MRQRFDPGLELDERTEVREARHTAGAHLACLVRLVDPRPRIGSELLQPEGDLLLVVVDAQDLDGDLVAGPDDLRRVRHAGPPHLGYMQQALHAATQIDEGAELAHGGDAPGHHRPGSNCSPDFGGARPLLLLEKRTP